MTERLKPPKVADTRTIYNSISATAIDVVTGGNAVENHLLKPKADKRFVISVDAYLSESLVRNYLSLVNTHIAEQESGYIPNYPEDFHFTLTEARYIPNELRREVKVTGKDVIEYYRALRDNLEHIDPIDLRLEGIILTPDRPIDPEKPNQRSISVVAAFTCPGKRMFKTQPQVRQALLDANLETNADEKMKPVMLVTIGRFQEPPEEKEGKYPIIDLIAGINKNLRKKLTKSSDRSVVVRSLEVIATTRQGVIQTPNHIFIDPPISFGRNKRSGLTPKFISARERRVLAQLR